MVSEAIRNAFPDTHIKKFGHNRLTYVFGLKPICVPQHQLSVCAGSSALSDQVALTAKQQELIRELEKEVQE